MENTAATGAHSWMRISEGQGYKIWVGCAFESLGMKQVSTIKNTLGISAVETKINICEMKCYADEFSIHLDYAKKLRTKIQGLKTVTKTKKQFI